MTEAQEKTMEIDLIPRPFFTQKSFWFIIIPTFVFSLCIGIFISFVWFWLLFGGVTVILMLVMSSNSPNAPSHIVFKKGAIVFGYQTHANTSLNWCSLVFRGRLRHHTEDVHVTLTVSKIDTVALYQTWYEKKKNRGYIVFCGETELDLKKLVNSDYTEEYLKERILPQEKNTYYLYSIPDFDRFSEEIKVFFPRVIEYHKIAEQA